MFSLAKLRSWASPVLVPLSFGCTGAPVLIDPGPIQAPDAAPTLVGPNTAYSELPIREWASIADGHVARVNADLVMRRQGVAELCQAPDPSASLEYFSECPAGSPQVLGLTTSHPPLNRGYIIYGPLVVQRRGQAASVVLTGFVSRRSLPPPLPGHCPLRARRGQHRGYRIEWTYKDGPEAYHRSCGGALATIILSSVILRGDGTVRIGDALQSELEPRLASITATSWGKDCGRSVAITLPYEEGECHEDRVIQAIGEYLRERNANDRIIIRRGLRSAPAIHGVDGD